ncbi:MAG: hypothetical protein KME64_15620 [Scytonematopsis contorta HA4267-MV1]|jgi:hypothetical protein|nr:hypothetical protein [Scytonematopsis contorta HA4267-MV1]
MIFIVEKSLNNLSQLEALVLINQWAKVQVYFRYDDKNKLDEIKHQKIQELFNSGILEITKVIVGESPFFQKMQEEIKLGGKNLNWFDDCCTVDELMRESDTYQHYSSLSKLYCGEFQKLKDEEQYSYELEKYAIQMQQYQQELEQYQLINTERDVQKKENEALIKEYEIKLYTRFKSFLLTLDNLSEDEKKFINKWNITKLSEHQKQRINRCIRERKFDYEPKPKKIRFPYLPYIWKPHEPERYIEIEPESYEYGTVSEVDLAIDWVKSFNKKFQIQKLNENFLCKLEDKISDNVFAFYKEQALLIFQKILRGNKGFRTPKDIYNALTSLPIDYGYLGMELTYDDFCKWHEVNLSHTGFWLIEFKSTLHPEILFHIPYDQNKEKFTLEVPHEKSNIENYVREVSDEQQKLYPIEKLVELLGYTSDDFPYKLQHYQRRSYCCCSDEEDCEYEEVEDDGLYL